MYLLLLLLIASIPLQAQDNTGQVCIHAIEQLSVEIGKPENLLKNLKRAEAWFTLHHHEEAIRDLTYVIENLSSSNELSTERMLLRALCLRHLCYSLIGQESLASTDLERVKPMLKNPMLKGDFPDYIEGLLLLITHEEAKKSCT